MSKGQRVSAVLSFLIRLAYTAPDIHFCSRLGFRSPRHTSAGALESTRSEATIEEFFSSFVFFRATTRIRERLQTTNRHQELTSGSRLAKSILNKLHLDIIHWAGTTNSCSPVVFAVSHCPDCPSWAHKYDKEVFFFYFNLFLFFLTRLCNSLDANCSRPQCVCSPPTCKISKLAHSYHKTMLVVHSFVQ